MSKFNWDDVVYKDPRGKNNTTFVVTHRDTTGMVGTQDKFSMWVLDKGSKVLDDLGSHVSIAGAKAFAEHRGLVG